MSEVISDKEYIKMIVRGEHKSSHIEVTPKSIFCSVESAKILEEAPND